MGVGERVGADGPPTELPDDRTALETGSGVDQDVSDEIGVDGVGREPGELPHPVGELYQCTPFIR